MNDDGASGYERLARMVAHELELVRSKRWRELHEAVERRSAFHAALPTPCPPEALVALQRAGSLHRIVVRETRAWSEELAQSLGKRRAVRRATRRYAGPQQDHRYSSCA
ncbi:MAG: hypothetical protein ACLP01_17825 [Solirubrobacteraceae bacterium]